MERPIQQRQMPQQRWQVFPPQKAQAKQIAEATALSPLLAQVLINRGLYTPEQAWEFLDPETLLLPSPLDEFPDLDKSLDLLIEAIAQQQKILICGDYDADGMTSTALLMRSLRYLGAQVDYAIPSRMDEGYGINLRIVEEFHAAEGAVIITVDNGIAAYEPVARAVELGLTVILTDHHAVPEQIPPATAILNPQLIHEASPYRGVAGVGVAYILAVCLAQRLDKMQALTATLLALFTLGTIADLAPLTGVNRRWVRRGLTLLPKSRIAGIQALIEVAGLSEEAALKPEAIGFRLGPRINAVGRIDDPQIVIDLLTTDDVGIALQRAMQCEETNKLRRQLCEVIEAQAVEWCEQQQAAGLLDLSQERVLVVVQPEWHHGVIGIVASRLVERYGVPVFIGTYEDKSKKEIRGSARSIPEFNVVEALRFCDDLLDKYGGHRAAGGFSFPANKLRQFKSRLSTFACKHLQLEHLQPLVKVDVRAALESVDLALFSQIDQIHPCGMENPDPVFWTAGVRVVEQRMIGKTKAHLKLTVAHSVGDREPAVMKAIAWRWGEYYPLPRVLDIAYKLRLNEWKGQKNVELEIVGVRLATDQEEDSLGNQGIRPWSGPVVSEHPVANNSVVLAPSGLSNAVGYPAKVGPSSSKVRKSPAQVAKEIALGLRKGLQAQQKKKQSSELPAVDSLSSAQIDSAQNSSTNNAELGSEAARRDESATTLSLEPAFSIDHSFSTNTAFYAEFYYSQRHYKSSLVESEDGRQLTIKNPEGHLLVVRMSDRQGFLYLPKSEPQPVNISELKYFNLVRAGLGAIELKQKTQLLMKQDELLADKDSQIATMKAQIELLEEKITQFSASQQQQFASLETERQAQEDAIQGQEAQIKQLQIQASRIPLPGEKAGGDIKQQVRAAVSDGIWFCLQAASQKDLLAAYQNYQRVYTDGPDAQIEDYSEAGNRLSAVVNREVLSPFFEALQVFLSAAGADQIGDIRLSAASCYRLEMLPPLLADQWRTFATGQLSQRSLPKKGVSMVSVSAPSSVSVSDRNLIQQFFSQWEHPMVTCLRTKHRQAASSLDQISQLRRIAAQPERCLYRWQYELLHQLIAGKAGNGGLLRQIFAP
ncbi:MAG: single-stranded-DNA-specific exonuclease RecJ [Leptolyngbya foveolarum]|uniref:Single-stranded-DNA-specific exonuclease RecJ n=1 Tax=Leptolyngbya foveolarum TaxID=47253 RepID=A0A2W4WAT8_9CYAN|nr:MAG: single-stranded-DNA-specific exonuclease RecJ [Leptolyngbya foveolarum]